MASLVTCVVTATTWCFCTAAASLLSACCGNDKPSTVAPGAASGRKRSVLLLLFAIAVAIGFQYGIASMIVNFDKVDNFVTDAWLDGCEDEETDALVERCAGNAGVYRSSFSAFIFFVLAGVAVTMKPSANREAWPAKYVLFVFLVVATCFIPNDPLFSTVYMNIARIGAILFIMVQQVIFVDLAYNWNDSWVEKSNAAEAEEMGAGRKWLVAILVSVAILFVASITGWCLLFYYFSGCTTNVIFIVATIIFCVVITLTQMSGEEASLLSSAVITAYATALCYSAVAKNDDEDCNPMYGEEDGLDIVIGVFLALVTLAYTGWSATADDKLGGKSEVAEEGHQQTNADREQTKVTGLVANDYGSGEHDAKADDDEMEGEEETIPKTFSNSWKLNFVLAIVSCWFAMALTGWGSVQSGGEVSDPLVSRKSMWMIVATQWLALALYLWTLVAPKVFPDRDFS